MRTKHVLLFLGLFFYSFSCLQAQKLNYGLMAGFDVSGFRWSGSNNFKGAYDRMPNYNFNVYLNYKLSEQLSLSFEPGYVVKGAEIDCFHPNDSLSLFTDSRIGLKYIQLPIMLEFYLADQLFLSAGPEIAFLLNADDYFFEYNEIDLGFIFGLNYNFDDTVNLGLRYGHSLTELASYQVTDNRGNPRGEAQQYNQYFQMILKYNLRSLHG